MDSKESPEIIDLVFRAKNGEELAGNILYSKYKQAMFGDTIGRMINFNFSFSNPDSQDAESIINEIFINAIQTYDSSKSKFITHLFNMIRWQFRNYWLRERMISITQNLKKEEMNKLIEQTICVFGEITDNYLFNKDKFVNFELEGEKFEVPESIFIQKFIIDKLELLRPKKYRKIYERYIALILDKGKFSKKLLMDEFKVSNKQLYFILNKCNEMIKDNLQLKSVEYAS